MYLLRRLPRRRSHFLILQAVFASIIICIAASMLYLERDSVGREAAQQADNIANTLQRDLERDVDVVDLVLRTAQTAVSLLDDGTLSADAEQAIILSALKVAGHPGTMLVVDAHGRATFDSGARTPRQSPDYVQRDWFTIQRDNAGAGLVMSLVPHNALTGDPVIVLTRRINHADGTFAGVVGASLDSELFEDLLGSLKLGPHDEVTVLTNEGRLIFRRSTRSAGFGTDYSDSRAFRAIRDGAGAVFVAQSSSGVERLLAQHQLRNLPLTVFVGLSVRDIYRPWWIEAATVGGAVVALVWVAFALSAVLRKELLRSEAAEAEAKQSEARYRMLADSTTDVIMCFDLDLRRTYVSPACRAVLGYEPEELIGTALAAAIHPQDRSDSRARFQRLATGEAEVERATSRFQHKLGHYVWVEANLALVRDPATGLPESVICSIRDISLRKAQADKLLEANQELERLSRHVGQARDAADRANRAKSRFLAAMSHELRTPLNAILGYADLLRIEGGLSTKQASRVAAMLSAGMHLLELINCVLDINEMETGHIELRPIATDLRALAAACLDFVRPAAAAKGLLIEADVGEDVPARVFVDATRLRQILINLLDNAVKFTPAGSVTLTIGMHDAANLRFQVVDTGVGIPPGQRDRLFQDFQRLGSDGVDHIDGAGLGLALSVGLAALMHGKVGYDDNPTGGSIFHLILPAVTDERGETENPAGDGGRVQAPAHLLVVDDAAVNRDIAASFLRSAGHHVSCAESGAKAVAMAAETIFDVVLMDLRMPQMDGLEASRRIRALGGAHGAVPIVALTAQAFTQHVEECRQAGMDYHLAKPFNQAALLNIVAKARANRDPERVFEAIAQDSGELNMGESAVLFGAELPIINRTVYSETSKFLSANNLAASIGALINRTSALVQDLGATPLDAEQVAVAARSIAGSAAMFGFQRLAAAGQRLDHAIQHQRDQLPLVVESLKIAAAMSLEEMRNLTVTEHQT